MSKHACQGGCCISNEMQLQWSWKKKVALRLGFRAVLLVEVVLVTSEIDGCGQNEELCYSVHQWMHLTLNLVSINEVLEKQDPGGGRRRGQRCWGGCGCLVLLRSDDGGSQWETFRVQPILSTLETWASAQFLLLMKCCCWWPLA